VATTNWPNNDPSSNGQEDKSKKIGTIKNILHLALLDDIVGTEIYKVIKKM